MKTVYVLKEYHGRGYGEKLVRLAVESARERGCKRIYLDPISAVSKPAICLYKKLGFRETEPYCESPVSDVFMKLEL